MVLKGFAIIVMILISVSLGFAAEINLEAIIQIESGGDPAAYNKKTGAVGLMQITPIVLQEYQDVPVNEYRLKIEKTDLWCPAYNRMLGEWYLDRIETHYCLVWNIPPTIENILIGWNWGVGNLKKWYRNGADYNKLPIETRDFIRKYNKLTKTVGNY